MEFSADTKLLVEALDQVQEAVEKKTTIPILSHVLIEASPNGLRLAATDLELGIRAFCPAQVQGSRKRCCRGAVWSRASRSAGGSKPVTESTAAHRKRLP